MLAFILFIIVVSFIILLLYSPQLRGYRFKHTKISVVGSSICVILGIVLILIQDRVILDAFEKRKWPSTIGEIVQTRISGQRAFYPELKYHYYVEGIKYLSTTDLHISGFGNKRSRRDNSERIIQEYSVGSKVRVYYDSMNPQISYLRIGPFWSDFLKLGVGVLLFSFGSFILIGIAIHRKKE